MSRRIVILAIVCVVLLTVFAVFGIFALMNHELSGAVLIAIAAGGIGFMIGVITAT